MLLNHDVLSKALDYYLYESMLLTIPRLLLLNMFNKKKKPLLISSFTSNKIPFNKYFDILGDLIFSLFL